MNTFKQDANYNLTSIRGGSAIGGKYDPSGLTANTWYRMVPSGNTAQKVASTEPNYRQKLNLGNPLRADITNANLTGWRLKILNTGYQEGPHIISENSGGIVTLQSPIKHFDALPASVEYVIYPEVLNPLVVHCRGANAVEFGRSEDEGYSLSKVDSLGDVETGEKLIFPYENLDTLCFRYATVGNTDRLVWGEHYII